MAVAKTRPGPGPDFFSKKKSTKTRPSSRPGPARRLKPGPDQKFIFFSDKLITSNKY